MRTLRKVEITPVFIDDSDFVPENLEQDKIYISKKYGVAVHLCLCGCGNKAVMDLQPHWKNGWALIENNDKISFTPSILNNNCPNRYHYIITNNVANVC